jgi:large conductance mechanosensitive channel
MDKKKTEKEKTKEAVKLDLRKSAQGFSAEFMEFLKKYQVIGLAVAFVIGSAASTLVTALVKDLIMPFVGVLIPGGDWQTMVFLVGPVKFMPGDFVNALINFIIIALVIFMLVKYIMKGDVTQKL